MVAYQLNPIFDHLETTLSVVVLPDQVGHLLHLNLPLAYPPFSSTFCHSCIALLVPQPDPTGNIPDNHDMTGQSVYFFLISPFSYKRL